MDAPFTTTSVPVAYVDTFNHQSQLSLDELFDYDAYVADFGLGNTTAAADEELGALCDVPGRPWDDAFESLFESASVAFPLDSASSDFLDDSLLGDSYTAPPPLASFDASAFDVSTEPFQDTWLTDYLLDSADPLMSLPSYPQDVSNDVPGETAAWGSPYLHTQDYTTPAFPDVVEVEDMLEGLAPVEDILVADPEVMVEPQEPSCKRKRQTPDPEIWPSSPKKARYDCPTPSTIALRIPLLSSPSIAPTSPLALAPAQPLRPILMSSPEPILCPIPGCRVWLVPKDSVWRGHFRKYHHADLCDASDCTGSKCARARCPEPQEGCKTCATAMSVESVGRHYLNVHVALEYKCPLCGMLAVQRESACRRHMKNCPGKA